MLKTNESLAFQQQTSFLDVYAFINPIDSDCYHQVCEVLDYLRSQQTKMYSHIILYQNLKMMENYLKKHQLPTTDLHIRNAIQQKIDLIALTFKAACFQGKKKSYQFLKYLKEDVKQYHHDITDDMLLKAACLAELDIDMLKEDRLSGTVKSLYRQSSRMIQLFNVRSTPSLIIFDSTTTKGILIENNISTAAIQYALQTKALQTQAK